jgi:hypothetical protein
VNFSILSHGLTENTFQRKNDFAAEQQTRDRTIEQVTVAAFVCHLGIETCGS